MRRPSRHPLSRLAAIISLVWPVVPVLAVWPGSLLWKDPGAIAMLILLFGLGPLWWFVGLAVGVGIGLVRRTRDVSAPAWVRGAPWVGAALNGAALVGWVGLMLRGGFC